MPAEEPAAGKGLPEKKMVTGGCLEPIAGLLEAGRGAMVGLAKKDQEGGDARDLNPALMHGFT